MQLALASIIDFLAFVISLLSVFEIKLSLCGVRRGVRNYLVCNLFGDGLVTRAVAERPRAESERIAHHEGKRLRYCGR
jgi:hypothetical protein